MGTARMLCREIHVGLKSDLQSDLQPNLHPPVGRALARLQAQAQAPGVPLAAMSQCREGFGHRPPIDGLIRGFPGHPEWNEVLMVELARIASIVDRLG